MRLSSQQSREILFHFLFSMVFVRVCERAHITFVTALRRISIFLVFGFSLEMDSFLSCFACSSFAFFRWRNRCCCLCIGFISNLDECLSIGRLHFDSKTYIACTAAAAFAWFQFLFFPLSLSARGIRETNSWSFDIRHFCRPRNPHSPSDEEWKRFSIELDDSLERARVSIPTNLKHLWWLMADIFRWIQFVRRDFDAILELNRCLAHQTIFWEWKRIKYWLRPNWKEGLIYNGHKNGVRNYFHN